MSKKGVYLRIIVFLFPLFILGQELQITGKVTDSITNNSIGSVSVILSNHYTHSIKSFTYTDSNGQFELKNTVPMGIYVLKIRHLNYHPMEKKIVLTDSIVSKLNISFKMIPKTNQLEEVIVKKTPPIIIKKDTIIYDTQHWTRKSDQTIEEVLRRIDGFKISPNGDIKVNGKPIRKVLVNGKEVANVGASILTKSIDPESVKSVEVRFDEKNNKIKESLLDTNDYAVLDIQMKKSVSLPFFGKVRATVGYLDNVQMGGYNNIFSLNKKANFHLFAEHDNFGNQTIKLSQIKNIGREAMQKIFDLPAEFEELSQREGYNSEIYGFKDYVQSAKSIVGFSSNLSLSDHWDLFFGSYNSLDATEQGRSIEQIFGTTAQLFEKNQSFYIPSSKNKLELRYDANDAKLRLDTNFIYDAPEDNTVNNQTTASYNFDNQKNILSFYNNLFFEYKISSNLGIELKSSYSIVKSKSNVDFTHNDPNHFFLQKVSSNLYELKQRIDANVNQYNVQADLQYFSIIGLLHIGGVLESRKLNYQSIGSVSEYTQGQTVYLFKQAEPYISQDIDLGDFSFFNKVGISIFEYSNIMNSLEGESMWNYYSSLSFSPEIDFNIRISYDNKLSSFPLHKLTKANTIIDFQTVEVQAQTITPQRETVFNFSISKKISSWNLDVDFAGLFGSSQTSNKIGTLKSKFLFSQRSQLGSSYQVYSLNLTKKFKALPLTLKLEPEALFNANENMVGTKNYKSVTNRWLLGFKLDTNFKDKFYNFRLYPKYTKFDFRNTLSDFTSTQEMLSLSAESTLDIVKDKLFFKPEFRHVYFFGNIKSKFTNISATLSGIYKNTYWFLTISNLTNDRNFVQQTISPNYFISQNSRVFGRYVKFGIEYKFK